MSSYATGIIHPIRSKTEFQMKICTAAEPQYIVYYSGGLQYR